MGGRRAPVRTGEPRRGVALLKHGCILPRVERMSAPEQHQRTRLEQTHDQVGSPPPAVEDDAMSWVTPAEIEASRLQRARIVNGMLYGFAISGALWLAIFWFLRG